MKKIILIITMTIIFSGCKSTKDIVYQHDTIYKTKIEYVNKVIYDSIHIKDSSSREVKNDTLYIETFRDRYVYKYLYDTINNTDTLYLTKNKEVEVVNKTDTWLSLLKSNLILVLIVLSIIGVIFYYISKKGKLN